MKNYVASLIPALFIIGLIINPSPVTAQQASKLASPAKDEQAISFPKASTYAGSKFSYKIIEVPGNKFGYNIFADDRLMISQTTIPAMPGNDGFKTKRGAEAVAELVIDKIKKGQMPPTVEIDEMKKLKAIP